MNTFPHIQSKTSNFAQTTMIMDVLEKRLKTLEKFLPAGETRLACAVELEKLTDQQSGRIFRAEVNLHVGGTLFRAEATEMGMEDAIEKMKNELKTELVRTHGRDQSLFRRGAQKLKGMVRFGS